MKPTKLQLFRYNHPIAFALIPPLLGLALGLLIGLINKALG